MGFLRLTEVSRRNLSLYQYTKGYVSIKNLIEACRNIRFR